MAPRVARHTARRMSVFIVPAACLLLAGCAGIVPMTPAIDANNPLCAEVSVRLGDVANLPKRETNAQATAAWGEPASILLTCGLEAPAPTTLPCISVNGVDWIMDDSQKPTYIFTTFGRTPAVQVALDSGAVSGSTVLADLALPVSSIPQQTPCTDLADTLAF
ncbi:unannotated protein [freshwater metagenome]|uniref:Unannotated protein n=1 Tax=freshwater metagenome TaxID=449393 RepID=A0A6J7GDC6_9ZZZZ